MGTSNGAGTGLWLGMLGAFSLLGLAGATGGGASPLLVNESPSLPRGLYRRVPGGVLAPGATVALAQPQDARPYLASLGMPASVLLIKRIAAAQGDLVCVEGDRVVLPAGGRSVAVRDRRGVALPRWTGCRKLGADELFLVGDTPGSFDSRYFGPVSRSAVIGVYRELVTW